jgi:dolichol-phosphate mannosyltransferase
MYASIILPTFNERESLPSTLASVRDAMSGRIDWEVIVVDDDSADRTWELAQELAAVEPRIRVYRRMDRKGLSSAIFDGFSLGAGTRLLVMDADLQHDSSKVPTLLAALDAAPLAIGTRYGALGSVGTWALHRHGLSRLATMASKFALGIQVSDPMSGFFALRKEDFVRIAPKLNPRGYKILMEIIHVMRPPNVREVPYVFAARRAGSSKLSLRVAFEFALSLTELVSRRMIGAQFVKYSIVGLCGVAVQYLAYHLCRRLLLLPDPVAVVFAVATAALSNYALNNEWTFRSRRYATVTSWFKGAFVFLAISATGAVIGRALSLYLHEQWNWSLCLSAAISLAVATLWNYNLNVDVTWRGHDQP